MARRKILHESSFEIRLDYKAATGKPDRVFLAMAAYVTAFEKLTFTVGKSLDAELNFSYELTNIQIGSLKSIITCKSKLKKLAGTLASIPKYIALSMVDLDSIDNEDSIRDSLAVVERKLLDDNVVKFPNQINVEPYQYAKDIKELCQAAQLLAEGETIDISSQDNGNVIYLNTKVKFDKEVDELFIDESKDINAIETLIIKKPVFIGDSQWDFKSVERRLSFSASIEHKEWLERFQKCELGHIDPGDALIAFVNYKAIKLKGEKTYSNKQHRVMHVERVVKGSDLQIRLGEEDVSENNQ